VRRVLGLTEPPLERFPEREEGCGAPGAEEEGGKGRVGLGGGADGAAAEEQLAEEDSEGDEAGEEEERVRDLEDSRGPWRYWMRV
jgi:hypothetical protein